jgi:hypothetical protein
VPTTPSAVPGPLPSPRSGPRGEAASPRIASGPAPAVCRRGRARAVGRRSCSSSSSAAADALGGGATPGRPDELPDRAFAALLAPQLSAGFKSHSSPDRERAWRRSRYALIDGWISGGPTRAQGIRRTAGGEAGRRKGGRSWLPLLCAYLVFARPGGRRGSRDGSTNPFGKRAHRLSARCGRERQPPRERWSPSPSSTADCASCMHETGSRK